MEPAENSVLADLFGRTPFLQTLDTLLENPEYEYTKKELAETTGISRQTLYRLWDRIEQLQLVEYTRKIGRSRLFRLNTSNPLVKKLQQLNHQIQQDKKASHLLA